MHILNDFLILWKELSDQFVQLDLVDPVLREVNLEGVPQGHHLQLGELVLLKQEVQDFSFDRPISPVSLQAFRPFSHPSSLSSSHLGFLLA